MSIIGPTYGTRIPSPATQFKDLGEELMAFGLDIETLLGSFDYNGADPNLVLARVAALETLTATLDQVGMRVGTSTERNAMAAAKKKPGLQWRDTDGTKRLYSCRDSLAWRQHEGSATSPAAAWEITSPFAVRSLTVTLPTVLDPHETLQVTHTGPTGFFPWVSLDGIVKNTTNTVVTIRYFQAFNATITPCTFAWKIVAQ